MGVDWRLALTQTGTEAMQGIQAFQAGQKAAVDQNALRRREEGRVRASEQLNSGDTRGAQQTAITSGDYDFAKAISSYSEDQRKQLDAEADTLGRFAYGIRNVPAEQREQAFMQMVPSLQGRFSADEIRQRYQELKTQGFSDQALDGYVNQALSVKDALSASTKGNEQYTLAPGSARYDAQGKLVVQQPFAPQYREVGDGKSIVEIQPGGGGPASGGGGALTVEGILPHIVAQESGGNYTARNSDTGALGAYQVMPATGQSLARQLGVPWRPDLMASDTPDARAYQDQIGRAAVQEAVNNGGGTAEGIGAYYYGGPKQQGPKSRDYGQRLAARINGGAAGDGGARVVATGAPKQKDAPSGYRWNGGNLEAIPGGPADPNGAGNKNTTSNRKASADLRKEFNNLPEVKEFKDVRAAYQQIAALAKNQKPSAQDDIAAVFSFMKMLDPGSVVREGEFATAQNASGVPDRIRNQWNKLMTGERLNPAQRNEMLQTARRVYEPREATYNQRAADYQGYARDNGVDPLSVAKRYVPPGKRRSAGVPSDIQAILRKYAQ